MNVVVNNIFSIFDPSSSYWSVGWIIMLLPLLVFNLSAINNNTNLTLIITSIYTFVSNEINQIMENNFNFTNPMFVLLFFSLFTLNAIAIFPYNFTPTAHTSISFSISVSIWLSTIMFGWNNQFNSIIVHLTPLGTPSTLINFIVVIETISSIIRPITLSIRLSANIVAGHLLISLLSSFSIACINNSVTSYIPIALLISLEIGVALVQAYVFITLILLYQNETS